jgi:hypothetical protein
MGRRNGCGANRGPSVVGAGVSPRVVRDRVPHVRSTDKTTARQGGLGRSAHAGYRIDRRKHRRGIFPAVGRRSKSLLQLCAWIGQRGDQLVRHPADRPWRGDRRSPGDFDPDSPATSHYAPKLPVRGRSCGNVERREANSPRANLTRSPHPRPQLSIPFPHSAMGRVAHSNSSSAPRDGSSRASRIPLPHSAPGRDSGFRIPPPHSAPGRDSGFRIPPPHSAMGRVAHPNSSSALRLGSKSGTPPRSPFRATRLLRSVDCGSIP